MAQPVPADGACPVPADQRWTPPEKFVWDNVCIGKEADFNRGTRFGGELDPKKVEGWTDSRVLTSAFLETILLKDTYRHALPRIGVRIIGARFKERVDLANAQLGHELWLDRSRLEQGADFSGLSSPQNLSLESAKVDGNLDLSVMRLGKDLYMARGEFADIGMRGARVGGQFTLTGAKVTGELDLDSLDVGQHLFLREKAEFAAITLRSARIHGQLSMVGAKVTGPLDMDSLEIGQSLFMRDKAEFAEVTLRSAHVFGQISLNGSKVTGKLNMNGILVDHDLFMEALDGHPAELSDVDLVGGHVGGQILLSGSIVKGTLQMDGLQVDQDVLMTDGGQFAKVVLRGTRIGGQLNLNGSKVSDSLEMDRVRVDETVFLGRGADVAGPIDLIFGKIGSLELAGGTFHDDVDVTGTQIAGELRLGSSTMNPARWERGAKAEGPALILRNAKVDAIQDRADAWPPRLDLTGFTYRNLGGLDAAKGDPMALRGAKWFEDWLGRQSYSPQPYEQLASVLRGQGEPDVADDILYTAKDQERHASSGSRAAWLFVLKIVIGYGYQVWLALIWLIGLLALGAVVQWTRPAAREHSWHRLAHYSFEMLLPVIRLRGQTREFVAGWQDYYFHFHSIMGFVFAAFLAAGLSGLTR